MPVSDDPLDREQLTEALRELLEHVRDVDDELAPVAEGILAELPED